MNTLSQQGIVHAVCLSARTGMRKKDLGMGELIEHRGLLGDAHAGANTHRQVSLLALESIRTMQAMGCDVGPGDFAENITTEGLDLLAIPVGVRIKIGDCAVLEISQHGKQCHAPCAIFHQAGTCVMPTEGVFATVIASGAIRSGDHITVLDA